MLSQSISASQLAQASPACLEVCAFQQLGKHNNLSCRRNKSQSDQTGNSFLLQHRNLSNLYQNITMLRTWNRAGGASHKDYREPLLPGGVSNVRTSLSEARWRTCWASAGLLRHPFWHRGRGRGPHGGLLAPWWLPFGFPAVDLDLAGHPYCLPRPWSKSLQRRGVATPRRGPFWTTLPMNLVE